MDIMKGSPKPVSLKKIAEETGVSCMTVSRALRSAPRVSAGTAARVRKAAVRLGYVPDVRIASVMASVRAAKVRVPEPVAWLNAAPERWCWRDLKWLTPYREGAQEQCAALGYRLDDFWLAEPGMTEQRMSRILTSRGIRGVIITPAPTVLGVSHLAFDWKKFCGISFENALLAPRLHRVAQAYHYNLMLALKVLRRTGYRRIGLFMQTLEHRRSQHTYLAALHYFQKNIPEEERVEPLLYRSIYGLPDAVPFAEWVASESRKPNQGDYQAKPQAMLRDWIERERPDVIIGQRRNLLEWLAGLGLRVPEDIGVAHLALDDDCADWAGIWQNKRHIGAQAVQQLVAMMQTNQPGIPEIAHETLIRGTWRYGKTIRDRR